MQAKINNVYTYKNNQKQRDKRLKIIRSYYLFKYLFSLNNSENYIFLSLSFVFQLV